MLNEFEIDQLRQLVHAYSASDVLRGLQAALNIDAEEPERNCRTANGAAFREAARIVGKAAAKVYREIG